MTLREKLELAGYRIRAIAKHMPTDWQRETALGWADDAIAASRIEARQGADPEEGLDAKRESLTTEGGDAQGQQSHD